jgi:hypothetical protein
MAFNPFLDNDYGVHWSEWGPDMQSTGVTHGGGDQDFWSAAMAQNQEHDAAMSAYQQQLGGQMSYSGAGGVGAATVNGSEDMQLAYQLLLDNGHTPEAAAAVLGNFDHETDGFKAMRPYDQSENSYGWAHWNGPRKEAFLNFASQNGLDPTSMQANIGYYLYEVQTGTSGAPKDFLDRLNSAGDPAAAAKVFSDLYERPSVPAYESRMSRAVGYYRNFHLGQESAGQQAQVSGDMPSVQGFSVDGYYRQGDRNSQGLYGPDTNYSHNTRLPTNLPMARGQNPYPWMRDLNGGNEDLKNLSPDFVNATKRLAALQGQPVAFYGGYRNNVENKERGGKPGSFHRYGKAGDIQKPQGISDVDYARMLRNSGFTGAGYYGGQRWHADTRETSGNKTTWGNWPAQAREVFLGRQASLMQQQPPALQQAAGLPIDPIDPYRQMIAQNLGMV